MAGTRAVAIEVLLAGIRDTNDQPLAGGKVYTYAAGTTTNKTTWDDPNKTNALPNPITLDSNGRAIAFGDGAYKFVIKDSSDTTTIYTWDNLYYSRDLPNDTYLQASNAAGSALINLIKADSSNLPIIGDGSTNVLVKMNDFIFDPNVSFSRILINTLDGSDTKFLVLSPAGGGGEGDRSRGGIIILKGNETSTNPGYAIINSGEVPNAKVVLEAFGTGSSLEFKTAGISRLAIDDTNTVTGSIFDWADWTPTYSASGSMTWTGITTNHAKYIQLGKLVLFSIFATGTTGGTADSELQFTLPVSPVGGLSVGGGCTIIENGGRRTGSWFQFVDGQNLIRVIKRDASNWSLAANTGFMITGFYIAA